MAEEFIEFGDNPGERLHRILEEAKNLVQSSGTTPRAFVVWGKVFGIEGAEELPGAEIPFKPLAQVAESLMQFAKLIDETELALKRIQGLSEKLLRPFPRVKKIPQNSLVGLVGADMGSMLATITESDMTLLELCAEQLRGVANEPAIDEGELQALLVGIDSLFEEINQGLADGQLKDFLLDQLEAMRRAIFEYRIRGAQRLKEGLATIVGNLVVERYAGANIIGSHKNSEEVRTFDSLFTRFAQVVTFAADSTSLLQNVVRGLLPGG